MTLGLVEPQSSGLGGGTFITTFNSKLKKVLSYNGRETAPMKIPENVFLDKNSMPKNSILRQLVDYQLESLELLKYSINYIKILEN